jgi:hypothetical protein
MKKKPSTAVRGRRGGRATTPEPLVAHAAGHRQDAGGPPGCSRRHVLTPAPMDSSNWLG